MRAELGAALLAAALAASACGSPEPPPRQVLTSNDGTYRLVIEPPLDDCPLGEPCGFTVRLEDPEGAVPGELRLEVDAAMPDHRHGLVAEPGVAGSAAEGWRVEGLLLHMPGYWEVYFDLTSGALTERAQAVVER